MIILQIIILEEEIEAFNETIKIINSSIKDKSIDTTPDDEYEEIELMNMMDYDGLVDIIFVHRQDFCNSHFEANEYPVEITIPTRNVGIQFGLVLGKIFRNKLHKKLPEHLCIKLFS